MTQLMWTPKLLILTTAGTAHVVASRCGLLPSANPTSTANGPGWLMRVAVHSLKWGDHIGHPWKTFFFWLCLITNLGSGFLALNLKTLHYLQELSFASSIPVSLYRKWGWRKYILSNFVVHYFFKEMNRTTKKKAPKHCKQMMINVTYWLQ